MRGVRGYKGRGMWDEQGDQGMNGSGNGDEGMRE